MQNEYKILKLGFESPPKLCNLKQVNYLISANYYSSVNKEMLTPVLGNCEGKR